MMNQPTFEYPPVLKVHKVQDKKYHEAIKERGIATPVVTKILAWPSAKVSNLHFDITALVVLIIIGIAVFVGYGSTCGGVLQFWSGCMTSTETEIIKINKKLPSETTAKTVDKVQTTNRDIETRLTNDGRKFNFDLFSRVFILSAFAFAFTRWHSTKKQQAMSEIFERKRSSNSLILSEAPEIGPLVTGAINVSTRTQPQKPGMEEFKREKCDSIFSQDVNDNPHGTAPPSFVKKMFVYMELDNLGHIPIKGIPNRVYL